MSKFVIKSILPSIFTYALIFTTYSRIGTNENKNVDCGVVDYDQKSKKPLSRFRPMSGDHCQTGNDEMSTQMIKTSGLP